MVSTLRAEAVLQRPLRPERYALLLKVSGFDFFACFLLQMNNHVDGVNAVQLQIFIQACPGEISSGRFQTVWSAARRLLINGFLFCHSEFVQARWAWINDASVATE